jgi:hypothetical protein
MRIEWVPLGIKTLQSASCSQASKQGRDVVVEGGHILVPGQIHWKREGGFFVREDGTKKLTA